MAERDLLSAVVILDQLRCGGRTLSQRAGAADKQLGSAGGHGPQKKAYSAAELNCRGRTPGYADSLRLRLQLSLN